MLIHQLSTNVYENRIMLNTVDLKYTSVLPELIFNTVVPSQQEVDRVVGFEPTTSATVFQAAMERIISNA
jgi:hypothetical protein